MRLVILSALVLAGCGEPQQVVSDGGALAPTAMQAEAEKACAAMTNYRPETLAGKPAETQALMQREYTLCIAAVAEDQAPALRGRTTAP